MDQLNRVAELTPHDAADRVDFDKARNALHREIARSARARSPRRLGLALGAGGSVAAVAGAVIVGVVLGGTGTVVSAVAPPALAPAVAPATAAEVLEDVALEFAANPVEIPAGSWLKATGSFDMLQISTPGAPATWEGGFSSVRTGAVGAAVVRLQQTGYISGDGADTVQEFVRSHPVAVYGDRAAVAAQWNAQQSDTNDAGDFEQRMATPPPADVDTIDDATRMARYSFVGSWWAAPMTPEEYDALSSIDERGDVPSDPQAFLDAAVLSTTSGYADNQAASATLLANRLQSMLDAGAIQPDQPGYGVGISDDGEVTEVETDGKPQALTPTVRAAITGELARARSDLATATAKLDAAKAAIAGWSADERAAAVRDAIDDLIVGTQSPGFATATPQYRATTLRAIALSPDLKIGAEDGDVTSLDFAGSDGMLKVKVDTAASQILEVDSFLTRQRNVDLDDPNNRQKWTYTDVGTSALIPSDVPDKKYTLTTEIVTEVPKPTQ